MLAPKQLLEQVYDEEIGFRLTSGVIKPVHVANGLGRWLTGRAYRPQALSSLLRPYIRGSGGVLENRNPNDAILRDLGDAFRSLDGMAIPESRLSDMRLLLREVIGADDGVYPDADMSSFGITNERMITRDPSDGRVGLFLARLLTAGPTDRQIASSLLLDLLATADDPVTTLALPMLERAGDPMEVTPPEEAAPLTRLLATDANGLLASPYLAELRRAWDRLATYEASAGSKLNSLRRLVLFGCFVAHVHAVGRWSDPSRGCGHDHPRPPILLDMFDGERALVRDASRSMLQAAADAIESLVRERFEDLLLSIQFGSAADVVAALFVESPGMAAILTANLVGEPTMGSIAEAYFDASVIDRREGDLEKGHGHPLATLTELGRRAGYLTPWANEGRGGRLLKRYHLNAEFLETLVCATVDPTAPMEFNELLDTWRDTYGVVVGRPQDLPVIERRNLGAARFGSPVAVNESAMSDNVEELRSQLVAAGLGKTYADGRTMVAVRAA